MNNFFEVIRAGINTTFQDNGRNNLYHIGIPFSGAIDKRNYILANSLLGNKINKPVIEFAYQGPLIKFKGDKISFVITGDVIFKIIKKKLLHFTSLKRIMLQRIQTLYLLLSSVTTGVLSFFVPLWTISDNSLYAKDENVYLCLFLASALLSIIAVFSFKSRQNQFVFGRLNIILNLILLGLFVYRLLNLPGALENAEKGIGLFLPVISIVLLVLANKAIKKDEALVKSVDRLR